MTTTSQADVDAANTETSHREVEAFKGGSAQDGKTYSAYLTRDKVTGLHTITTWMGDVLATVITIKSRPWHKGYTTNERGSFWARGVDGKLYHGTHNGAGMYCRMRISKRQTS